MKEEVIRAMAHKHHLPIDPRGLDYPWAYTESVLAFARDLVGEEWPDPLAFPPMPHPVVAHSKLGDLFARFDMQMYAVSFEKRARAAISEELGLHGADAGNPELILQSIKDMRVHADHCALDSWWVKSLMEFWGNGSHDQDTRRAAKVACNVAAQFFTLNKAAKDVLANGSQHDVGGGDVFLGTCDSTEALQRAVCDCADGKVYSDAEPEGSPCPECAVDTLEDWLQKEYGLPIKAAGKASFGLSTVRKAFELGQSASATSTKPAPCAARKQGTAGGNDPADCDWPGCGCDKAANKVIDSLAESGLLAMSKAQEDVLKERAEHYSREGFAPVHDDKYNGNELVSAAIAYAHAMNDRAACGGAWPWNISWWKPKTRRRNLVKAASLLIAAIEKIDRAAAQGTNS